MKHYRGEWRSKKYPARFVSGTASAIRTLTEEGHCVTQMIMRYGGMFKHLEPVQLEHVGELPTTLAVVHQGVHMVMCFEENNDTVIAGKYQIKDPRDVGEFSMVKVNA